MGLVLSAASACCGAVSLATCCLRMCSCDLAPGDEEDGHGGSGNGGTGALVTKAAYTLFLLVGYVLALCVKDGLHGLTERLPFLASDSCELAAFHDLCYGHSSVFRISFALVGFYLVHLLLSCDCGGPAEGGGGPPAASPQSRLQTRMFGAKVVLFVLLLLATGFIGTPFLTAYAKVAMAGAGLFIVIQILVFIDFAYEWNEAWVEREEPKYQFLLLACSLGCFAVGCVLIGFMYHWFTPGDDCVWNATFIHLTLFPGLLYLLLAIRLEHVSVLPASFVFLYSALLCYSAIQSGSSSGACNLLWTDQAAKGLSGEVLLSSAFAIFTLLYSCVSSAGSAGAFQLVATDEGAAPPAGPAPRFGLFHAIMVLGSMYLAMILTNWSTNAEGAMGYAPASMWVKIIGQWVTVGAFVWSMFAPLVLTDRSF